MDIAVIGAAGDCGRQIAARIVSDRIVEPTGRLQLVGRRGSRNEGALRALTADLEDAGAEGAPHLDVCHAPEEVVADIVIFAAGVSGFDVNSSVPPRDQLARANLPIFREYAETIARNGSGDELVVVVTNPVELGVEIFGRALGPNRVLGIGAYSDTLRFRREIAKDLGIRRQRVRAFVLGEHGDAMIPAWHSVHVHGFSQQELHEALPLTREGAAADRWDREVTLHRPEILSLLARGEVAAAIAAVDRLPADLRVLLRPLITQASGAKTAFATAAVTVELLQNLQEGRTIAIAAQAIVDAGFHGIRGVFGVPLFAGDDGICQILDVPLSDREHHRLAQSAERIRRKIADWSAA